VHWIENQKLVSDGYSPFGYMFFTFLIGFSCIKFLGICLTLWGISKFKLSLSLLIFIILFLIVGKHATQVIFLRLNIPSSSSLLGITQNPLGKMHTNNQHNQVDDTWLNVDWRLVLIYFNHGVIFRHWFDHFDQFRCQKKCA